ncbi:hypothetical protein NQ655_18330, partial [Acinetobacter baumannii]|nr:hypothetical protein [Acinetobacter baumannii]
MFKKIKENTGLEWVELTSILIVLSVGYPFLYKVGFYNELGIGWYLNTGTAFSIFVSSVSVVFWGVLGLILGYLIFLLVKLIPSVKVRVITPPLISFIFLIFSLQPVFFKNSPEVKRLLLENNFSGIEVSLAIISVFLTILVINKELSDLDINIIPNKEKKILTFSVLIIFVYASLAWSHGDREARNIWKYRGQILNKVELKSIDEKWFLVDYAGDKALILKEGNG